MVLWDDRYSRFALVRKEIAPNPQLAKKLTDWSQNANYKVYGLKPSWTTLKAMLLGTTIVWRKFSSLFKQALRLLLVLLACLCYTWLCQWPHMHTWSQQNSKHDWLLTLTVFSTKKSTTVEFVGSCYGTPESIPARMMSPLRWYPINHCRLQISSLDNQP